VLELEINLIDTADGYGWGYGRSRSCSAAGWRRVTGAATLS
jgi:hypothetical protein